MLMNPSSNLKQVEFLIRRVPLGRVYAIRRDIERQCLGLIRDGNTATIVDVVPNSLSARHGLPPKVRFYMHRRFFSRKTISKNMI